jgi:hypothetical protein
MSLFTINLVITQICCLGVLQANSRQVAIDSRYTKPDNCHFYRLIFNSLTDLR